MSSPSPSPVELPPLYFQNKGDSLSVVTGSSSDRTAAATATNNAIVLPAELAQQCLTQFATLGDLAKLACVQRAWRHTLVDSAASSPRSQWNLACAWWHGFQNNDSSECDDYDDDDFDPRWVGGLERNVAQAVRLLQQLVVLSSSSATRTTTTLRIDPFTFEPIYNKQNTAVPSPSTNRQDQQEEMAVCYSTKAMKKLAHIYLNNETNNKNNNLPEQQTEPVECTNTTSIGLAWLECAFWVGGDVESAYELAVIYESGRCAVGVDVVQAYHYFSLAAAAGHVPAMTELALCLELGCGVAANDELAVDWYVKAATAGHVEAQFAVAQAFEEARGVPQSDAEACLWYYKAALKGDEDSRKALRRLEPIARIVVPGFRALLGA